MATRLQISIAYVYPHRPLQKYLKVRCSRDDPKDATNSKPVSSQSENAFLKVAWYSSELLGVVASLFHPASTAEVSPRNIQLPDVGSYLTNRIVVVESIKDDFQKSYFVTGIKTRKVKGFYASLFTGLSFLGNLTPAAYEENCEFADPAGSFKGLARFKRNCTNFGRLIDKSEMKLTKWEELEDKGIGHWRFSCVMSFPWKPILSATGYTEYFFDPVSGKICKHVEHWNVPKMALFKQLLRSSRRK